MGILDAIQTGLSELLSHKMRSMLTMLGVIFGVAAVIAMVSIGEGAKQEALDQIKQMGIDVVHIKRVAISGELFEKAQERSPFGLRYGDARNIAEVCPFAKQIIPLREVFATINVGETPATAKVMGTVPGYDIVTHSKIAHGRFLEQYDIDNNIAVCVLGATVKRELFGFTDPIGKFVKITNRLFRVVGIMEPKELSTMKAGSALRDLNTDVYIPITVSMDGFQVFSQKAIPPSIVSVRKLLSEMRSRHSRDKSELSEMIVQVESDVATVPTASLIRSALNRSHRGIQDYKIEIPAELLKQQQAVQRTFSIVLAAIASISLLVGGIGIMNIMLATVTQRTREIGVRRCIGATRWDIVRQFMLEALVITCIGGLIGVAVGVGGANAISIYAGWRTAVSTQAVIVSFGVSAFIGVIFGLYPAVRAAMVDPIEALRYS